MSDFKISPSQLKTAFHSETGCIRKWAFNKIEGQRSPPTAATTLGTNVHAVAEDYLNLGTVPNLSTKPGKIFASGIHLLPDRKLVTGVEKNFNLRFNDNVTFHGIVDFMGDDFIGDHKTTSNFRYALKPEELVTDYQGVLYGMAHATDRNLGLTEKFKLIWVYYLTRGKPQARRVQIETNRVQLERTYFPLAEKAEQLVKLKNTVESALEVEPNYSACGAFGGCPFRNKCESEKPVYDFSKQNMEKDSMSSLLERLKEKQKTKTVKSQNEMTEKCDTPAELVVEVPKVVKKPAKDPVESQVENDSGYTLYIDCAPKVYNDFTEQLSQIANQCAEKHEVDHYRMIPYGQGKAAFSLSVRKALKKNPITGNYVVDSTNLMASDCLEELISGASEVVRAFK